MKKIIILGNDENGKAITHEYRSGKNLKNNPMSTHSRATGYYWIKPKENNSWRPAHYGSKSKDFFDGQFYPENEVYEINETRISEPCPSPEVKETIEAEAEKILKDKLKNINFAKNPDYTFNKVIEAMIEFRNSDTALSEAIEIIKELRDYAPYDYKIRSRSFDFISKHSKQL